MRHVWGVLFLFLFPFPFMVLLVLCSGLSLVLIGVLLAVSVACVLKTKNERALLARADIGPALLRYEQMLAVKPVQGMPSTRGSWELDGNTPDPKK